MHVILIILKNTLFNIAFTELSRWLHAIFIFFVIIRKE